MTRHEGIKALARTWARLDGYEWQRHPNMIQGRKQSSYETKAAKAMVVVEAAMEDFQWKSEFPEREALASAVMDD